MRNSAELLDIVEERARNWSMAIGLQDVDRLKPSEFLLEQAKANIEGRISSEEVGKRLKEYYSQKSVREKAEADGTFSKTFCLMPESSGYITS